MHFITAIKNKLRENLLLSFIGSEPYFFLYGAVTLVGVLLFYAINSMDVTEGEYESLSFRLICAASIVPLIFNQYWPGNIAKYKIWYWYFVLILTVPCFFSYMILMNPYSNIWHINGVVGLIILTLFVDWVSFLLLLTFGIIAGLILYSKNKIGEGHFIPEDLLITLYSYIGPIVYVIIFTRKNENIHRAKLDAMKSLAATIAHEMRTPLAAIRAIANNMHMIIDKYKDNPDKNDLQYLQRFSNDLSSLVTRSNHTISTLLINLRDDVTLFNTEKLSIQQCVDEAISLYPFSYEEQKLITIDKKNDFMFKGNADLIRHVFFNLIQNSLHFIHQTGKGSIIIKIEPGKKENILIFNDTAKGIPSKSIQHLFKAFRTDRQLGSGIGLSFCQRAILSMNGKISCQSIEGEYTSFYISFPTIELS